MVVAQVNLHKLGQEPEKKRKKVSFFEKSKLRVYLNNILCYLSFAMALLSLSFFKDLQRGSE